MIVWIAKFAKVFTEAPVTTTVSSVLLTVLMLWIALLLFDFARMATVHYWSRGRDMTPYNRALYWLFRLSLWVEPQVLIRTELGYDHYRFLTRDLPFFSETTFTGVKKGDKYALMSDERVRKAVGFRSNNRFCYCSEVKNGMAEDAFVPTGKSPDDLFAKVLARKILTLSFPTGIYLASLILLTTLASPFVIYYIEQLFNNYTFEALFVSGVAVGIAAYLFGGRFYYDIKYDVAEIKKTKESSE